MAPELGTIQRDREIGRELRLAEGQQPAETDPGDLPDGVVLVLVAREVEETLEGFDEVRLAG